ncbi:hypothetical protein EV715DRAFT_275305 [Schizophyllum commune]
MVGDSKVDGKEGPLDGRQTQSPFDVRPAKKASRKSRYLLAAILIPLYLGATFYKYRVGHARQEQVSAMLEAAQCPVQPTGYRSVMSQWPAEGLSAADKELYVQRLSKAIQMETVSYDDMYPTDPLQSPKDGGDERWLKHARFNAWVRSEWPLVYEHLEVEYVTKYSTLLTLPGTNPSLPPVLLMSHQDTVPVQTATIGEWHHPPFEGRVTDSKDDPRGKRWIYGRGALDCKGLVTSELNALERIVKERLAAGRDIRGERTVVMSIGFDEEIMGIKGAGNNSRVLQERYGQDSFAFVIDEGSTGIETEYGLRVASLGLSEKGSMGAKLQIDVPGGHASKPPRHTGLGILSLLIAELEAHPNPHTLNAESLYLRYLTCLAQHAPSMPSGLRSRVLDPTAWPALADDLAQDDELRAHLATTMAANVARAGEKINALPEHSEAIIDSRVGWDDTVAAVQARYAGVISPVVEKLNLTLEAFGETVKEGVEGKGKVTLGLSVPSAGREHAPITPSEGPVWELIAGTVRHVWGEDVIVAPKGMIAGTDTNYMKPLSKNIFRFRAVPLDEGQNVHTVNERITDDALFGITQYVYELLVNLEGWRE